LKQLGQELSRAALAGKMGEALRLAVEVEALRRRWQGASHWQEVNARYGIDRRTRQTRLSAADQKEVGRVQG
jgi:hypothetical protein